MMLKDLTAASNAKFQRDTEYVKKVFGDATCIEGCVVNIEGREGKENYKKKFCDPLEENTFKIMSHSNIVLFFRHAAATKTLQDIEVCRGVSITKNFSFSRGYEVANYWQKPADLPGYLECFIAECVTNAFDRLKIGNRSFFEKNFTRGGMMPIKEMKRHPEWKAKYYDDIEKKDVHVCKSCGSKPAYSGCCPYYSLKNRTKIRMVIGWS